MPWYRAGTVAVTAGQTTVTGTGTNFAANSRVGDAFQGPDGRRYEVTNIASTTVLSILPAYQGPTVAAGAYAIEPVQGYPKALADSFREVNTLWGATLAGLGSVSVEDLVPVVKGGTGGSTPAMARAGIGALGAGDYGVGVPAGTSGVYLTDFAQAHPSGFYRGAFSTTANSPPDHIAGTGYTCVVMPYIGAVKMLLVVSASGAWIGYYAGGTTVAWVNIVGIGTGQRWKNVTASRELNTTYTNTTGRPIQISAQAGPTSAVNTAMIIYVEGASLYTAYAATANVYIGCATAIIPAGATYRIAITLGSAALTNWSELS